MEARLDDRTHRPPRRLGLASPTNVETTFFELDRLLPPDLDIVSASLHIHRIAPEEVADQAGGPGGLESVARELRDADVDLIAVTGGPIAYFAGPARTTSLVHRLEDATGLPVFHDVQASVDAICALGVQRVALVSPFTSSVNAAIVQYLREHHIDVAVTAELGLTLNPDIRNVASYKPYHLARRAVGEGSEVDAVFITCGGWSTLEAAALVEGCLGIPVVTQMLALAWRAYRELGVAPTPAMGAFTLASRKSTILSQG